MACISKNSTGKNPGLLKSIPLLLDKNTYKDILEAFFISKEK